MQGVCRLEQYSFVTLVYKQMRDVCQDQEYGDCQYHRGGCINCLDTLETLFGWRLSLIHFTTLEKSCTQTLKCATLLS